MSDIIWWSNTTSPGERIKSQSNSYPGWSSLHCASRPKWTFSHPSLSIYTLAVENVKQAQRFQLLFPIITSVLWKKWATTSAFLLLRVISILWPVRGKQYGGVWPNSSNGSMRTPHRKLKSCKLCRDIVHSRHLACKREELIGLILKTLV